jgi:hypothetical protein
LTKSDDRGRISALYVPTYSDCASRHFDRSAAPIEEFDFRVGRSVAPTNGASHRANRRNRDLEDVF